MATVTRRFGLRHSRSELTFHVLRFRRGRLVASGPGLAFWFRPLIASVAEVPLDDRELPFLFHGRSADYQETTTQGTITYRFADPELAARRVDFTVDLAGGLWRQAPLEHVGLLLTQMAQQLALAYLARTPLRQVLVEGLDVLTQRIEAGLGQDERLAEMGITVVGVRLEAVQPTAEVDKALQVPVREAIQQEADEATFQRRALAVEKERAITENELQSQIELARREEQLVVQRGQNDRRRVEEEAVAARIAATARAERTLIEAEADAQSERLVQGAAVEAERARIDVYRDLPVGVLLALAAREIAGKLQSIDHLNITPDMLTPLLGDLLDAGTRRLAAGG